MTLHKGQLRFLLMALALAAVAAAGPQSQSTASASDQVKTSQVEGGKAAAPAAHRNRYAIVISIDGLMPESYTEPDAHELKVPALRSLVASGAWSPGVVGVMPAVTYPSHTTMVTGVSPRTHGITGNAVFDPTGTRDGEWFWYAEEIRVPALWSLAKEQGLRTAMISWPATMGARGDAVVPEFWRGRGIDGVLLLRAISTRGLLDRVAREFPDVFATLSPPVTRDDGLADIAVNVIERERPNLLLLHLPAVDHWQHEKGPWSPEARAAIENADAQIARVIEAGRRAGIWERTLLLVVSDHGFTRQERTLRPSVLLRQKGLITVDEKNRIVAWRAQAATFSGSAYIYLKDPSDSETQRMVLELFRGIAGQAGSGIRRVLRHEEIVALGGDPAAFLALEAADGFGLAAGVAGDAVGDAPTPGIHGFPPDREMMRSSWIMTGPAVAAGKLEGARLVDVAPTVAYWLGLSLEKAEGKPQALPAPAQHFAVPN